MARNLAVANKLTCLNKRRLSCYVAFRWLMQNMRVNGVMHTMMTQKFDLVLACVFNV